MTDEPAQEAFPVTIDVDASKTQGALKPIWRFFGADEPNYATMPNGQRLLGELGKLRHREVYFRTHNLLTTGDGKPALKWGSTNIYTEDSAGRPVYDFKVVDEIFDTYLRHGVRPYVQIGFMPEALSSRPEPYRHHWAPQLPYDQIYTGWSYPPANYDKWGELVFQWAKHCVERYGPKEVEHWYWEVWNEPNIGYWHGSREEFLKLHATAIQAVRRALPSARVGGPDTAGAGGYLDAVLSHWVATDQPTDFVSFHAKGAPEFLDGHVRMGIANQLRAADDGFARIAAHPELKDKPIVIGESDPDGCAACQGPQLGYRNGTMYSSYTAASMPRMLDLADRHGVNLEGALTWAFEFEGYPYFAGFRQLATNGIDMPVLNVFRMLSKMDGERVSVESTGATSLDTMLKEGVRGLADVSALASLQKHKLSVLVWNYHDDDVPAPDAEVHLNLHGLSAEITKAKLTHYRIDESHSNAYTAWQSMGSPQSPTDAQLAQLRKAGQLQTLDKETTEDIHAGTIDVRFSLPSKGVSFLVVQF